MAQEDNIEHSKGYYWHMAELDQEWGWTEKFSAQPDILAYVQRLAP